jgi:hypothetical protein
MTYLLAIPTANMEGFLWFPPDFRSRYELTAVAAKREGSNDDSTQKLQDSTA